MQSIQQAQQEAKAQGNAEAEAAATKSAEQFAQLIQSMQAAQQQQQDNSGVQQNAEAQQQAAQSAQQNADAQQQTAQITQQLGDIINNTNPPIQQFGEITANTQQPVQALGDAANAAVTNISSMSTAAQQVSTALQNVATTIANIKISVPSVNAAPVAANYMGGIYGKGAFMTTFAEKSPEAAIPIDGSKRAIELWKQTGAMLGVYDGATPGTIESTPSPEQQQREISKIIDYQRTIENISIAANTPTLPTLNQLPFNPFVTTQAISKMPLKMSTSPVSAFQNTSTTNPSRVQNQTLYGAKNDFVSYNQKVHTGGEIPKFSSISDGGILDDALNWIKSNITNINNDSQSFTSNESSFAAPNVTINLTINGNADADTIKDASNQLAIDFSQRFQNYMHERERRSYQ